MPLTSPLLSTELQVIANNHPVDVPAAMIAWSVAYNNWMLNSIAAVPLNPAIAALAQVAMQGALATLGVAAPAALGLGVAAYWAALNVPGAYGPSIATVPPPTLGTLPAALIPVFLANTVGALGIPAAQDAIAAIWLPTTLGGQATIPGPINVPIL